MKALLPPEVVVVEAFDDPPDAVLFPGEGEALVKAVDRRRREYTTVRHCARQALADLGLPPAAIPTGPNREPLWPAGVLGSLTHCDGYRAAALARVGTVSSLGIDAEPHEPLPDEVLRTIARPEERPRLKELDSVRPDIHWNKVLFCAKESVYKAWFPLAHRWLGFEDASVRFAMSGAFDVELHVPGPTVGDAVLTTMHGRWQVRNDLILTAVVVPA